MSNIVDDKLMNYSVWEKGKDLGTSDITLPDLEALSDTLKGAGISGEVDMPTIGMFGKMATEIAWRTINDDSVENAAPGKHDLEFFGAQQRYDSGAGEFKTQSVKVNTRLISKKFGLGKLTSSASTDSSNSFECVYIKITIDGKEKIEIDKFAQKCIFNGKDYLEDMRKALGYN